MLERYQGEDGRRLRVEAALDSKLAKGNQALAEAIADVATLRQFKAGQALIEQGGDDNQVYILISGSCDVIVNAKVVNRRGPGDHVGEMAAIQPAQRRSATIMATEQVLAFELPEPVFANLAATYPDIYRLIAKDRSGPTPASAQRRHRNAAQAHPRFRNLLGRGSADRQGDPDSLRV